MTKVYLLNYSFSTGIYTFEVPKDNIEGDEVEVTSRWWIREQKRILQREGAQASPSGNE